MLSYRVSLFSAQLIAARHPSRRIFGNGLVGSDSSLYIMSGDVTSSIGHVILDEQFPARTV